MKLGFQQAPFVNTDFSLLWGRSRPVRSDEWLVLTPLAIAQYNHEPKFPILNKNLGEDGQNMLIVGMAGVPVKHLSAFVKPATWGFFIFDLKRALAWYWYFPIFANLFALWGVSTILIPLNWRLSFSVAMLFSLSSYVAAWSNWPAYAVFFPSMSFVLVNSILKSSNKGHVLMLGFILGATLAGFVLVLYPPWQVSLGYAFLVLFLGILLKDRLYKQFNIYKFISLGISLIVTSFILWRWWTDAYIGIQAMMNTIYPGQRNLVTGGGVSIAELLRGFTNVITLYKLDVGAGNSSEYSSFMYMFLPIIPLFAWSAYQKKIHAVEIALALVVLFDLNFMMLGVSAGFAKLSLWGRVLPSRADISLGLCCILLYGQLLSNFSTSITESKFYNVLAILVAICWASIVLYSTNQLHLKVLEPIILIGIFIVVFIGGYWLAIGNRKKFIGLNMILSMITIAKFNPINIAPNYLTLSSSIETLLIASKDKSVKSPILILESQVPAMYLAAAGYPVINGVFYYPQQSLWERLDKEHSVSSTYNRYQHLIFLGSNTDIAEGYKIESPQADVVKVVLDLARFDFKKTGAEIIGSPRKNQPELLKNPLLSFEKEENGWSWFRIKKV